MSNYSKTTDFEAKDSLPTGDSGKIIRGAEFETEFDAISTAIATKADTAGPTFTGTLTFETISDGTIGVTAFVDEDNMASNSATLVPTQQSVKAYVDSQVTAQDLDFQADTGGALSIDLDSETMTFTGGTGIDTSGLGNAVTFAIDSTVATLTGTQTLTNKTLTSPDVNTPDIDGGTIDGTVIGGTTPAAVSATTVSATSNITVGGTVDGRDVATDGTKLDGIEASADVTDTANVTAAGALMDSELTSIASVKALNQGVATTDSPTFAAVTVNGNVEFDGLSGTGAVTVTDILDQDDMSGNSATALATQQSIKAYVDSQVATADTLSEVLANGNTTGGTDIAVGTGDDITFADSSKAIFGAGSDLQIYHDGSASYIDDQGTGSIIIKGTNFAVNNSANSQTMIAGNDGADVKLFYAGANKLATTSSGIDVTGRTTTDNATVGSGTASTYVDLTVNGASTANYGPMIELQSAGTAFGKISNYGRIQGGTSTDMFVTTATTNNLLLGTNNTRAIQISSGGDISFYEDTGTTAKLFWDASAESLGIGTSSPAGALHIHGGSYGEQFISSSNSAMRFVSTGGVNYIQSGTATSSSSAADLIFTNVGGSGETMRIDSSGNVGIGTSSPDSALVVQGGQGTYAQIKDGTVTTLLQARGQDNIGVAGTLSNHGFGFFTNSTERMRIDSSGNVGIGTSSPSSGLSGSNTNLTISDADGSDIKLTRDTGQSLVVGVTSSNDGYIWGSSLTSLSFRATTSEAMRLDASGNLLVGTTDTDTQNNNAGSTADNGFVYNIGSGGYLNVARYGGTVAYFNRTSTDGAIVDFRKDGSTVGSIGADGGDMYLGTGITGVIFNDANNAILPYRTNAEDDANINLGLSSFRFKDLHLSGTAYSAALNVDGGSSGIINFGDVTSNYGRLYADSTGTYVGSVTANPLILRTTNTERARIDSSGNLLVGKTSTSSAIEGTTLWSGGYLNSTVDSDYVARFNRLSNDGEIVQFQKDNTAVGSIGTDGGALYISSPYGTDSGLKFASSIIAPSTTTGANRDAAIDLGYSSSRFKDLYLSGVANVGTVKAQTAGGYYLTEGTSNAFSITSNGANGHLAITDEYNSSERLRITQAGDLLVRCTALPTGSVAGFGFTADQFYTATTSTSANTQVRFYNGNGLVGNITTDGSATAFNTSSDQRLKDNIVDAPSASDDIDAIQVRSFDWKADGSHQKYGMVAQELQSVAPDAVSEGETEEDMMSIDYSKLVPMMLKEIQSLRARVAQLEGEA